MVKFIDYTGRWPNLCSGTLTLEIEGEVVRFSSERDTRFWYSGGSCEGYNTKTQPWIIEKDEIPEKYRKYYYEIVHVFNENVEWGCCGGCV